MGPPGSDAGTRESSLHVSFPPPLTLTETDDGPLWGPFFFLFQRGLAVATALRRLVKYPKSVSEPALSLTDRPRPSEGRIQKVKHFQCVGVFGQASFSKFQLVAKFDANRGTGLKAVVWGGFLTFAAFCTNVRRGPSAKTGQPFKAFPVYVEAYPASQK